MKADQQKKRTFLFHPILFGLYPVLALYIINRNETVFAAITRAAVTSVIVTVLIIGVYLLIFRSWQKAAAPASLTLLLFYSYGHVYDMLQNTRVFGVLMGRDRVLVPVWIILFIVGVILLLRSRVSLLNQILNTVSLVLMIFVCVQLGIHIVQYGGREADRPANSVSAQGDAMAADPEARDVYYILVDAYSRQDLLQEKLGLDTSDFISELTKLGFYIPECAQSNYDNTLPSMTTALNMNYLDAMGLPYFVDSKSEYKAQIKDNLVMQQFKEQGYDIATFKSLYRLLDFPDQTYYYDFFKDVSAIKSQASVNFQYLFLKTTLVRPFMEFVERNPEIKLPSAVATWIPVGSILESHEYQQYQQNVFALESLEKIPDLPGRKFVYAHLYITHQPFVFYPDGEFQPFLQQGELGYRDQVMFADTRLLEIIKTILAKSQPAPIIVLQSDHSYFQGADRVKILNAYYLPDGGDKALYPTITPVNTFRVIFNTYFGGNYELLPDVSRYSQKKVLYEAPSTCVGTASGKN